VRPSARQRGRRCDPRPSMRMEAAVPARAGPFPLVRRVRGRCLDAGLLTSGSPLPAPSPDIIEMAFAVRSPVTVAVPCRTSTGFPILPDQNRDTSRFTQVFSCDAPQPINRRGFLGYARPYSTHVNAQRTRPAPLVGHEARQALVVFLTTLGATSSVSRQSQRTRPVARLTARVLGHGLSAERLTVRRKEPRLPRAQSPTEKPAYPRAQALWLAAGSIRSPARPPPGVPTALSLSRFRGSDKLAFYPQMTQMTQMGPDGRIHE
jgi:hypothetical protein